MAILNQARYIVHIDMDAYYAAIEIRENPSLADKPVIVGGRPGGRGVVSTCNYIARTFGVRSAMPTSTAARICPHAVFVRSNFALYVETSRQIRTIFKRYTDAVEPLSLDEAYLDLSRVASSYQEATNIANSIRAEIFQETKLTCSAGIAPNKMLAKISSEQNKPNGFFCLEPQQVFSFMRPLPVHKIPGVGPVSRQKLKQKGIEVCGDIWEKYPDWAESESKFKHWLWKRSCGLDNREVQSRGARKSIGHERTFRRDLAIEGELLDELQKLSHEVAERMQKKKLSGKTITLKVKYHDFELMTRSRTSHILISDPQAIFACAVKLFSSEKRSKKPIRLLGLSLSGLVNTAHVGIQPSLF